MPKEPDTQLEAMKTMVALAKERTEMAKKRSEMSADRSEMSAQRTYMNTERTLSVWIRTALASMLFGIAIDRFGLLFKGSSGNSSVHFLSIQGTTSSIIGAILILFSMFMALSATSRFIAFTTVYKKKHSFPPHHKPLLPIIYAGLIVVFGGVLLVLMLSLEN